MECESAAEHPLAMLPRRRVIWLLFLNFLKIATFVVGGGYAILLAADRMFVEKLRWLRPGELIDMMAVVQTIPGLMAGNVAVYVGYRAAGRWGALAALAGVALPSFTIITLISLGFSTMPMENVHVQGAFVGVRAALGGLTLAALIRMWRGTMKEPFGYVIMLCCFLGVIFVKVNPAWLLGGAIVLGLIRAFLLPMPKPAPPRQEEDNA